MGFACFFQIPSDSVSFHAGTVYFRNFSLDMVFNSPPNSHWYGANKRIDPPCKNIEVLYFGISLSEPPTMLIYTLLREFLATRHNDVFQIQYFWNLVADKKLQAFHLPDHSIGNCLVFQYVMDKQKKIAVEYLPDIPYAPKKKGACR